MKKLYAVLGDPIAHSMSPTMHNDIFQSYQLDAHYHAFHVKPDHLEDAVKGLKAIGVSGFNITIPHKEAIMPYLDEIDPLAKAIGAVNTVVNENGKFIGFNTDGSGFVKGLLDELTAIKDKKVLIIGAGGAARGIYFAIAQAGVAQLDIENRTILSAEQIIQECPFPAHSRALSLIEAEAQLDQYDIIVQTTSIGMEPHIEGMPISLQNLQPEAFVSDIIYNPLETRLLREARMKGAKTQGGIEMFVYQGALAFEMWTGIYPDTKRMKENVIKQLGGTPC